MNEIQKKTSERITNWFWFKVYGLSQLPLSLFTGIKITELNDKKCTTKVKYKWLNKNPFRSTYWAVLAMAAELTTGSDAVLATIGKKEKVSTILVSTKADFFKKATSVSMFVCEDWLVFESAVNKAIKTNLPQKATGKAIGLNSSSENIAYFEFTWSFKVNEPS